MPKQSKLPSQDTLNKAFAMFQQGEHRKAEALARSVLATNPRHAPLLQFIGILCDNQQRHDEAVALFSKAIQIDPLSSEGHYNLGSALLKLDRCTEAVASLERSLALQPGNYDVLNNLGLGLNGAHRYKDAERVLRQALDLAPKVATAYFSLGLALAGQRRFRESTDCFKIALAQGHHDPGAVYRYLGDVFGLQGRSLAAYECFQKALQYKPKDLTILLSLADAELFLGRYTEAAKHFATGVEIAPNNAHFVAALLFARRHVADWQDNEKLSRQLTKLLKASVVANNPYPFYILSLCDDLSVHLKVSRQFSAQQMRYAAKHDARGGKQRGGKLRVAYISCDFLNHATATLAAGLFEQHNRESFETFAYSWGEDDGSPMRRRLQGAFDHFIDISAAPDETVAQQMRDANIDIAVDLKGFTSESRCGILVTRPAPIQVNFLGYPGTMGAEWIDYIVADPFIIPCDAVQHYSEKVVFMPDCYQVNDSIRPPPGDAPERGTLGLPEQGFVFACFNNTYKITPDIFGQWMSLLTKVPGSVLWLYCQTREKEGQVAVENLRREASIRGVKPERLIFAPSAPSKEHMQRLQCADLFLDTSPCNAHTTASDALWAGVPVLTQAGKAFQARVAGSLLRAVGLPQLIASSADEYESIAFRLATDIDAYRDVRSKLGRRSCAPLFDTARFTKNIEVAYKAMWARHLEGKPPDRIDVAEISIAEVIE
jgi:protein O-GlcNAc transferase